MCLWGSVFSNMCQFIYVTQDNIAYCTVHIAFCMCLCLCGYKVYVSECVRVCVSDVSSFVSPRQHRMFSHCFKDSD